MARTIITSVVMSPAGVDLTISSRTLSLSAGVVKLWICDDIHLHKQDDGYVYFDSSASVSCAIYEV